MISDLVGGPASRFDLQQMSVKIFQIVVHSLEVFPARLFVLHCGTVTGNQLLVVAFKERF
jgi:hypothetical protein